MLINRLQTTVTYGVGITGGLIPIEQAALLNEQPVNIDESLELKDLSLNLTKV